MTNDEIKELMVTGQNDGAQLYRVADAIYKISIALISLILLAGVVLFFVALDKAGLGAALAVAISSFAISAIFYAFAVIGSTSAKVIVHLLFSNLALLEKYQEQSK